MGVLNAYIFATPKDFTQVARDIGEVINSIARHQHLV